jgi:group I intron endonuclease
VLQNKINNKIYVGQTNNLAKRRREHKAKDRLFTKRSPLYQSIQKYGFENFEMIPIEEHTSEEAVDEAEEFWIQFFQSRNREFGYNLAEGGKVNRGFKHSEEFKQEQSERKIEYYKTHKPHNYGAAMTTDAKDNLSKIFSGEKSLNAKFSNEQVKEMRRLYATGEYTQTELAQIYHTSTFTMSEIVRYKRYKLT